MPLTKEQKRDNRQELREAALAGDEVSQAKRAAERERIEARFSRSPEEDRERLRRRRRDLLEAACDADHERHKHAVAVLDRHAQRSFVLRNEQRAAQGALQFSHLEANAMAAVAELLRAYPSCEPSVVWRYVAEHPAVQSFDVLWFAPAGTRETATGAPVPLCRRLDQPGQVGSAAPHPASRHLAAEPLARLEALAHFRCTIRARVARCVDVARRLGPVAGRTAFAQELTRYSHDEQRRTSTWCAAGRHDWRGDHYTRRMGTALWCEAWDANADALAADYMSLDSYTQVVRCAAALHEVEKRLEEMSLFPPLRPEDTKLDETKQWVTTLGYDGTPIGIDTGPGAERSISLDVMPSSMGAFEGISTAELGDCCAALYLRQPYVALQPWRLTAAQREQLPRSTVGELLRDPPRVSLGLASQPGEPDDPVNWVPRCWTIEYSDGPADISSRASMPTVDIKCRLFVLNLPWSTTEGQLWEHLGSAVASQALRSVVILRWADGRSRGLAKVVMRTPDDVATAIRQLNGEALGGRPLTLCHDRLQPRGHLLAPPNPCLEEDGPMDLD